MLHLYAALAEKRRLISERTKAVLAIRKIDSGKPGNPANIRDAGDHSNAPRWQPCRTSTRAAYCPCCVVSGLRAQPRSPQSPPRSMTGSQRRAMRAGTSRPSPTCWRVLRRSKDFTYFRFGPFIDGNYLTRIGYRAGQPQARFVQRRRVRGV